VASRALIGCASAWFGTGTPPLITEIAFPTQRGIATALYMCGFYVGGIIAAFTTFGTRNMNSDWAWRIPAILQILLPAIALPGLLLCDESPRWLVSMDRGEQARKNLVRSHAGGNEFSPLVNFEIIGITETLRAENQAGQSASYTELFATPGNRKRLVISVSLGIFSQWVGNGVVSYYLALVLDTVGITSVADQTLISACLQIWNLLVGIIAAFLVDRVGRRPLFLTSAGTMLVGIVVITGLSGSFSQTGHAATGTAVIPFLFVFYAGYDIAL
jgi:MFS family permease